MYKNVRKANKKHPPCLSWCGSSKYKIEKYKTQKYTMNTKVQNAKHKNARKTQKSPPRLSHWGSSKYKYARNEKHKNPHLASPSAAHLNDIRRRLQKMTGNLCTAINGQFALNKLLNKILAKLHQKLCIYAKVVQTCALLPRSILHYKLCIQNN